MSSGRTLKGPDVRFTLLQSTAGHTGAFRANDLEALAVFALARQRVRGPVELTVEMTGPRRIQELNRRFRGVDRTTDVISFKSELYPLPDPLPGRERGGNRPPPSRGRVAAGRERGFSGDIAINVHQASHQAKKIGHSARREVRLLLIHGILHLLGFTDYAPQPRRRMFKRQNALLRSWETGAGAFPRRAPVPPRGARSRH